MSGRFWLKLPRFPRYIRRLAPSFDFHSSQRSRVHVRWIGNTSVNTGVGLPRALASFVPSTTLILFTHTREAPSLSPLDSSAPSKQRPPYSADALLTSTCTRCQLHPSVQSCLFSGAYFPVSQPADAGSGPASPLWTKPNRITSPAFKSARKGSNPIALPTRHHQPRVRSSRTWSPTCLVPRTPKRTKMS